MSTGVFGPEARWQCTRVYRGSNQSSSSRSRRDFLILNLSGSSNLSSKVGPSETQGSLPEIQIRRGCLVSGKPDRNRKKRPTSTMFWQDPESEAHNSIAVSGSVSSWPSTLCEWYLETEKSSLLLPKLINKHTNPHSEQYCV